MNPFLRKAQESILFVSDFAYFAFVGTTSLKSILSSKLCTKGSRFHLYADPSQRVVSLSCLFASKLVTALVVAASSTGINHRIEGDPIRLALATLVAECYGISTRHCMVICTLLSTVTTNELQALQCAEELQSGFPRAVRTPENEKFHDLVRCYLTPGDKT